MQAVADLQVIPVGSNVSTRESIERAVAVLSELGLEHRVRNLGTEICGDLPQVLAAVHRIHETLHEHGDVRLVSNVKLETRTDKEACLRSELEQTA